ncbi:MAG: transglycosylase domain-containing protein, partial [Pseudomonadota bacterium]|nr:transglycosylase domain-containing protein [Pseudomonadota bacterium]
MKFFKRLKKLFRRKKPPSSRYPSYRAAREESFFSLAYRRVAMVLGGALALVLAWCFLTLPNIDDLNKFTRAPSVLIKSEDGQIIGSFGDIYGDYIPFAELPLSLIDAVIATEDRNFYHHFGIDPWGLLRAAFADLKAGHVVQGGSTITQQVAKNVFLTPERSFTRKIKEMLLAVKLEKRFSKEEILSIYLNRVYLGAGNFGVDAASRRYFNKSARELTLPESAILAGLLKAPSRFAPTANPTLARKRAEQVLFNMQEAGYLNESQTARAREDLAKTLSARPAVAHSLLYFADWIMDQLPEYVGTFQEDLVVTTTLRPDWQLLGEKAMSEVMDKDAQAHDASQAAMLAMTPDGAVRVMIGGRSYGASQFNRVTQAERQPGSAFKLFVYLAALEAGMTPDTLVDDRPFSVHVVGGDWQPHNYNNKYLGTMPLKEAVAESINTVAVQVAQ